jgi:RNA polymerase sigma factor (sigma-70 family)
MSMSEMRSRRSATVLPHFQALLDEHAGPVFRFLVREVGMPEADDCFQETWLSALRAYPQLSSAEHLRGWIFTIARNKAHDARRAQSRRPVSVDDVVTAVPVPAPAERDEVWDEVRELPAKQRAAVTMRFAADLGYADIARSMATTEAAARRNVHEGVKKLRRNRT